MHKCPFLQLVHLQAKKGNPAPAFFVGTARLSWKWNKSSVQICSPFFPNIKVFKYRCIWQPFSKAGLCLYIKMTFLDPANLLIHNVEHSIVETIDDGEILLQWPFWKLLFFPPPLFFLTEDEQREKSVSHHTVQQLIVEKEQALADLNSVEKSLADLFRRYEKMKEVLEGFRKVSRVRVPSLEERTWGGSCVPALLNRGHNWFQLNLMRYIRGQCAGGRENMNAHFCFLFGLKKMKILHESNLLPCGTLQFQ